MGFLTKVLSKIVRPSTERPKPRQAMGPGVLSETLTDNTVDPLVRSEVDAPAPQRTEGRSLAKGLKKAGGRAWNKKSNYAGIRQDLKGLDEEGLADGERWQRAQAIKQRVEEWSNKHGTDGKRGKAMDALVGQLDGYGQSAMAGWDPKGQQALASPEGLDKEGLESVGSRAKGLYAEVTRLEQERRSKAHTDQEGYERADRGAKANRAMWLGLTGKIEGMERSYLKGRVDREGLTGGAIQSKLGSGNIGTVHTTKFGDRDLVFKEETPMGDAMLSGGFTNEIGSMRAVASKKVDDLLGTGVLTETHLAEAGGKHGIAMENAVGTPTRRKEDVSDIEDKSLFNGHYVSHNGRETFLDTGIDYSDPTVQEGLVDLQLNDIISGQLDRHAGNYHVEHDEGGKAKGVHAFDNDMAFPSQMGDWQGRVNETKQNGLKFGNAVDFPPVMSERQAGKIQGLDPQALRTELSSLLPPEEVNASVQRLTALKVHVGKLREEGGIVEAYGDESFQKLRNGGERSSYVARDALQQENMRELEGKLKIARGGK